VARLRIRIIGLVQGVGFRHFVRVSADRLELSGWVRNCPDGSVEVAAEGTDAAREALLLAVRRGPPGAAVEEIVQLSVDQIDPPPTLPFRVIH